jgi:hypothetical protein
MSRQVYLLGSNIALVAFAFGITDRFLSSPGITEPNVRRIQRGMTIAQVQSLLGGKGRFVCSFEPDAPPADGWETWIWAGKEGRAWVTFTTKGRVKDARFDPASTPPPWINRLCTWLGW